MLKIKCFYACMNCVMLLPPEHPLRYPREASHQLHKQRLHRD